MNRCGILTLIKCSGSFSMHFILNSNTFAIKYKVLLRDNGHLILWHGMNKSICNHLIITSVPGRDNNCGARITGFTFVSTLSSDTKEDLQSGLLMKTLVPVEAIVKDSRVLCDFVFWEFVLINWVLNSGPNLVKWHYISMKAQKLNQWKEEGKMKSPSHFHCPETHVIHYPPFQHLKRPHGLNSKLHTHKVYTSLPWIFPEVSVGHPITQKS